MALAWLLVLFALLAGAAVAAQSGVNSTLGRGLGDPALAALVSFAVGTLALLSLVLGRGVTLPDAHALAAVPWWAWVGGVLGAFYVTVAVIVAPRLGAAALVAFVVAAQLSTALALDHFGWLGFVERAATWPRLAGVALLAAGAMLVRFG